MTYKTILVHCDAAKNVGHRLGVAAELAERHSAHLVGFHARQPFEAPVFFDGGFPMDNLYKSYEASAKADQESAKAAFEAAIKGRHLSTEWRVVDGFADSELVVQARYADLLVLGQADPESSLPTPADLPEAVALASGRPVLVVPHIGVTTAPGKTVLLCWNASREAARAASEALPVLKAAAKVIVLVMEDMRYTVPQVVVQRRLCALVRRGARRADLGQDVDAISLALDNVRHAAHLAFDATEPGEL
ncbi:MAG: hypothetical protein EBY18_13735 [Alphaproteobacteria bacterium]|nr:hypothetical protein [Alphaproteobacteria bacterium]